MNGDVDFSGLTKEERNRVIANATSRDAIEALVNMVRIFTYDYFVTLTFRKPRRNIEAVVRELVRIGKAAKMRRVFWVIEPHEDKSRGFHAHGIFNLKKDGADITVKNLANRLGRNELKPVTDKERVVRYMSKSLDGDGDYYLFPGRFARWDIL